MAALESRLNRRAANPTRTSEIEEVCIEYTLAMNEHPSYLVYQHLPRFLQSRGLTAVSGMVLNLPRDRFTTELDHIGYFRLDAEGPDRQILVTLILALQGKYTDHAPHLRTLLGSFNSEEFAREGRLDEVLMIVPEDVCKKKHILEVVQGMGTDNKPPIYNIYPYHVLSLDIPRAQCVYVHEIVEPSEVRDFLARERLTLADLQRISASDPPVIWLGARPNQVVRIRAPSETAGVTYYYKLVVREARAS